MDRMAKPMHTDIDEFFREQKYRMELSDEDWDEYEERVHEEKRKRKREEDGEIPLESKPGGSSSHVNSQGETSGPSHLNNPSPSKKQKLNQRSSKSPVFYEPIIRSPPSLGDMLPPQNPTTFTEVSTSSKFSQATAGPSARPRKITSNSAFHVRAIPTSPSSNVTTPAATPIKSSGTLDAPSLPETSETTSETTVSKTKTNRRSALGSKLVQAHPGRTTSRKISAEEKERAEAERLAKKATQQTKRDIEKAKKAQDEKEALMTPLEYAAILQKKWQTRVSNTPPEKLFLKDKVVFLVFEEQKKSSKDTRAKLDIIAKHGGTIASKYDTTVTHIILGSSTITLKKCLRALGLKSLSEIPPDISTVKWEWIVSGLSKTKPDSEIIHEAFKQRIAYKLSAQSGQDNDKGKGKEKRRSFTKEHSIIEDYNSGYDSPNDGEDKPARPLDSESQGSTHQPHSAHTTSKTVPNNQEEDPLLPFYAKAREEVEVGDSDDESLLDPVGNDTVSKFKGFQCDKKGTHLPGASPNWDIIEKLAELREIHRDNGTDDDKWRVISYQKAIGSLKSLTTRIKSREEALKLWGVSDKTADKIMEIINTGKLRRINYTKTVDLAAMRLFSGIYGVGSNTSRKWYNQGLKSLEDVRQAVKDKKLKLSSAQEIGLEFYKDINDRMPRSEARELFELIKPIALALDPKLSLEIMGSFRRGKETCGDIDILLTRPTADGKTHAGILLKLCNSLHKQGILTEDLALPDEWEALEATYRGLCRKDPDSKRRRIDILCIPYESRGAARIYYTVEFISTLVSVASHTDGGLKGDDIFNRSIRLKANKMSMSLNQRGLFEGVIRDPQDRRKKMCTGSLLCSDSEKKIFEILGVPWQEPHERVRGG